MGEYHKQQVEPGVVLTVPVTLESLRLAIRNSVTQPPEVNLYHSSKYPKAKSTTKDPFTSWILLLRYTPPLQYNTYLMLTSCSSLCQSTAWLSLVFKVGPGKAEGRQGTCWPAFKFPLSPCRHLTHHTLYRPSYFLHYTSRPT